jgi:hypothetical protein
MCNGVALRQCRAWVGSQHTFYKVWDDAKLHTLLLDEAYHMCEAEQCLAQASVSGVLLCEIVQPRPRAERELYAVCLPRVICIVGVGDVTETCDLASLTPALN